MSAFLLQTLSFVNTYFGTKTARCLSVCVCVVRTRRSPPFFSCVGGGDFCPFIRTCCLKATIDSWTSKKLCVCVPPARF